MSSIVPKPFLRGPIFVPILMVAIVILLARQFGLLGFAIGIDLCVVIYILASFSKAPSLRPFSNRHLAVTDIGTLVAICLILHGLALPPHTLPATSPGYYHAR
ncbi:MAG: hypothetical protein ABL921_22580 [Pirellula sp.]